MSFTIRFHKKLSIGITNFVVVLALLSTINLSSFSTAQDSSFWHIDVGNYLNITEATQELNRLNALDFKGSIVEVSENGTVFNQLRVGCFLNEAIATSYLASLKNQLIYPSLSAIAKGESPATELCLGFETGIDLPNQWQIIRDDEIFLLKVTLLDYVRLIGFNGLKWQNFQTEDSVSTAWQNPDVPALTLECQHSQTETIDCNISDYTFTLDLNGEILWQKGNTVILKIRNSLKVLSILEL